MFKSMFACETPKYRATALDGLIGAGVMIGLTLLFTALQLAAKRAEMPVASGMLQMMAFPGSFALSMPFWSMKGQPWRAQAAIVAGTVTILLAIAYLNAR